MRYHLLTLLAVLVLACGPAQAAPPSPPLGKGGKGGVVLFVTDDQGQDAGCYGNPVLKTPHLDQLAAEGTKFNLAFCTTASCSPSRSVILTGLYNHANGQYGLQHSYHHFSSYDQLKSLPILMSEAGYRTARIGKFHVAPEASYKFDQALPGNARSAVELANNCRQLIAADSDKPFFLYFCTADPHRGGPAKDLPHTPDGFGNRPDKGYPGVKEVTYDPKDVIVPPYLPDTPACRAELAQYYQSISRADQGLGRLVQILKETGKYDSTLIIYISDHGAPWPGSKTTTYEPGLRAPCVVRHPSAKKRGLAGKAMVSWIDIAPTILDFAGAKIRPPLTKGETGGLHGRSFLPVVEADSPTGWDAVFAAHTFHEVTMYYPMRVVRTRQHKLIWNIAHGLPFPFASDLWGSATWQDTLKKGENARYGQRTVKQYVQRPQFELYDLEKDPHEVNNLAGDPKHAQVLDDLKAKLREFQKRTSDPWILKWDRE